MRARLANLWRSLFRGDEAERQLDDELRFDLERRVEDHTRGGRSRSEARRRAACDLGGLTQVKESAREVRPGAWAASLVARELIVRSLADGTGTTRQVRVALDSITDAERI